MKSEEGLVSYCVCKDSCLDIKKTKEFQFVELLRFRRRNVLIGCYFFVCRVIRKVDLLCVYVVKEL